MLLGGLPTVPYFPGCPVFWPHCPASRLRPSRDAKCPVFWPWTQDPNVLTSNSNLGKLILGKIIKITVATRCHILKLKCIKFDFGWGSAPRPAWGSYTALPDPLAGFKDPTCKGRKGRVREGCPVISVQFVGNRSC